MNEGKEIGKEARLIDRYLSDALSGSERQEFLDRLDVDAGFRDRVVVRKMLVDGIRHAADVELKEELIENINYSKPIVPFGLRMMIAFLLVIMSSILVWNYLGSESALKRPVMSFKWFTKKGIFALEKKEADKPNKTEFTLNDSLVANNDVQTKEMDSVQVTTDTIETVQDDAVDQEIVVKKDQLQISLSMAPKVVRTSTGKAATNHGSMSDEVARKLNPAAGLVEEKVVSSENLQVEFWLSPVNYHGYKWNKNTLLLYGIESPDQAIIFKSDEHYFLRFGAELYELQLSSDFQSYKPIKDPELLQLCK